MAVLVTRFARRDGREQQSVLVEQKASINGSPELRYELVAGRGVEAIVNRLFWNGLEPVKCLCSLAASSSPGSYFIRLRVSQKLHTSSQVVVGAIVGSVFCIFWYTTWNSLLLEAFESSLLIQTSVFLVAAALTLAFAIFVVLNWFRIDR
ncbi:hypothetical protein Bca52824_070802 [Brassica carinata]|uniref:Transmembrane protein n=1 Tax=Brassica carinata TaxID=52824 RepID=A0A8X7Q609_BRACI|nr:hypothetical protein Bca52824_070802 [Brassica carinata]